MSETKTWVLTDNDQRLYVDALQVGPADVDQNLNANSSAWSLRKTRLRGGPSDGVDLIDIDNGVLAFSVLPTRGMGIWRGCYHGLELGWRSPVHGPVHPDRIALHERGGLGWLTGFDEMIVRCGLDSSGAPGRDQVLNNNGVATDIEHTLHGKIANTAAARVAVSVRRNSDNQTELLVSGEVYETGLFCPQLRLQTEISTVLGSNVLQICDQVTNLRALPAEFELLYHCNFGPPFLAAGSRLELAAAEVLPRDSRAAEDIDRYADYLAPTPGYIEQVYWHRPLADAAGDALAMLRTATADKAVVLRFNTQQLPSFAQWKNTAAEIDGYVTGLEPGTDLPNSKAFERHCGRLQTLAPGETRQFDLRLEVLDDATAVAQVLNEIATRQSATERRVRRQPHADYSPPG